MHDHFVDRREAGQELAAKLKQYGENAVVLALPRGGVETAVEVALDLGVPLDLVIARKIGHPGNPEYAVAAVTEKGPAIWNEAEFDNLDAVWRRQAENEQRDEAKRRRLEYLADRQPVPLNGKTAILVDDGIATGLTMQAAIAEVRRQKPAKIIVAVPVAPRDTVEELAEQVDGMVVLINPRDFAGAVGSHYDNFSQLTDDDVLALLDEVS
jgi:putative phosphoribosyl transferase